MPLGGNQWVLTLDATVIRSDYTAANDGTAVEGNEGAIVLEGLDENGEMVQVVWSPNFDLETWYFDNSSQGQSAGFYTQDLDPNQSARVACFAAGTWIRVPGGERLVEDLQPGDAVETLDNGPTELLWCASSVVPGLGKGTPVTIAPELFGANAPLTVSPQHRVLVRHPSFEIAFGSSEVMVPVKHLVDGRLVTSKTRSKVSYHHLLCERHEIIYANGVETESMLLGDQSQGVMSDAVLAKLANHAKAGRYGVREAKTARIVIKSSDAILVKQVLGLHACDGSNAAPPTLCSA